MYFKCYDVITDLNTEKRYNYVAIIINTKHIFLYLLKAFFLSFYLRSNSNWNLLCSLGVICMSTLSEELMLFRGKIKWLSEKSDNLYFNKKNVLVEQEAHRLKCLVLFLYLSCPTVRSSISPELPSGPICYLPDSSVCVCVCTHKASRCCMMCCDTVCVLMSWRACNYSCCTVKSVLILRLI